MQPLFNNAASPLSEAEQALQKWRVPYTREPDGTIFVPGSIMLSHQKIYDLPDLSRVVVKGDFYCDSARLASLKGAPQVIGGGFFCGSNDLVDLKGGPKSVGGDYYCGCNPLRSLEGAPAVVGKDFFCEISPLTSLKGGPAKVGRFFMCSSTQIANLEHAPREFQKLRSRFGEFETLHDIPLNLLYTGNKLREMELARLLDTERVIRKSTVLDAPLPVKPPLRLKKPPVI